MSLFEPVQYVPFPVRFEEVETSFTPPPPPRGEYCPQNNGNLHFSTPLMPFAESNSAALQLSSSEINEDTLDNNGLFCIRWMCFAHQLSRAMQDNQRRGIIDTGGMVTVACREKATVSSASIPPDWTFLQIERSFASTASLVLRNKLQVESDNQPIIIENVSPTTMERIIHYVKFGSVYGPLDKLEEFLEANRRLRIGAVWPLHYTFICVTWSPSCPDVIPKYIHSPWSNIEDNFADEPAYQASTNNKNDESLVSDNWTCSMKACERSIIKIPNASWEPPSTSSGVSLLGQQFEENLPSNNQVMPSSSSLKRCTRNYLPKKQRPAASSSNAKKGGTRKELTVNLSKFENSAPEKKKAGYFKRKCNMLVPRRSKSAPVQLPFQHVAQRPIKRRYRRTHGFTLPISPELITPAQQNITYGRPIKRTQVIMGPPLPRINLQTIMMPPPPPTRPKTSFAGIMPPPPFPPPRETSFSPLPPRPNTSFGGIMPPPPFPSPRQTSFPALMPPPPPPRKTSFSALMPPPPPPRPKTSFGGIMPPPPFPPPREIYFPALMPPPSFPSPHETCFAALMPPPKTGLAAIMPPPRTRCPRAVLQPYVSSSTSLRKVDTTLSIVPDCRKKSQKLPPPPPPAVDHCACYHCCQPQHPNWGGEQCCGNTPVAQASAHHDLSSNPLESPEIKTCQWCKLTFGSSKVLRLHQLFIHTKKESLLTFPIGSVAAANRANFDSHEKQQQN